MSESGDYTPGVWAGHDFSSARRTYDAHVGRSYDAAVSVGKKAKDLIAKDVSTNSTAPVIIAVDQTGSMGDWPATMFSKLPYLDKEGQEYLGEDLEFCFMAFGDAYNNENYPLQVRPFAKGLELEKTLKELVIERGGGGQMSETSELAAFFALKCVSMPKAVKPIFIIITDEKCYNTIDPKYAEAYCGIKLEKTLTTKAVFEKLKEKYSVYLIRKPYSPSNTNRMSSDDIEITDHWKELVGADHIAELPSADRVVDVIFGIFAKETNRIAYFEHELEDRQLPDKDGASKVAIVYKSLATIHNTAAAARAVMKTGNSVTRKSVKAGASKSRKSVSVKPLI